jgi:hypothetical protein
VPGLPLAGLRDCYSCHTGKDDGNVACFVNQSEVESFKIGRNYPATGLSEKHIVVPDDKIPVERPADTVKVVSDPGGIR